MPFQCTSLWFPSYAQSENSRIFQGDAEPKPTLADHVFKMKFAFHSQLSMSANSKRSKSNSGFLVVYFSNKTICSSTENNPKSISFVVLKEVIMQEIAKIKKKNQNKNSSRNINWHDTPVSTRFLLGYLTSVLPKTPQSRLSSLIGGLTCLDTAHRRVARRIWIS